MLNQEHIGKFRKTLSWVAEKEGKFYLMVNEHNTTKECCICGNKEKKTPKIREFTCKKCNTTIMRDSNSAVNIAKKANFYLDVEKYKDKLSLFTHTGEALYGCKAQIVLN